MVVVHRLNTFVNNLLTYFNLLMKGKIKASTILVHAVLWMVYVALEYLSNIYHIRDGSEGLYVKSILLTLPALMIPTYFVIWVVVPRFLKKRKILASVVSLLLVIVFVFYGRVLWLYIMNDLSLSFKHIPVSKIFKNVIRDYSVIALAVCIYLLADWRHQEKLNLELTRARAEAELKLLKGQLHPHFLFNTLNNIYSLALIKSEMTADAILKLTDLLDYLVYRANSKSVALSKEVQLINTYIDLERLRHDDKLVIDKEIEIGDRDISIAPLVMLPFVENCFKHGGSGLDGIFQVQISILFENETLTFKMNNTVSPEAEEFAKAQIIGHLESKRDAPLKGLVSSENLGLGGVGLDNIRKRLNLIYPDRHQLIIEREVNKYSVSLKISCTDEV